MVHSLSTIRSTRDEVKTKKKRRETRLEETRINELNHATSTFPFDPCKCNETGGFTRVNINARCNYKNFRIIAGYRRVRAVQRIHCLVLIKIPTLGLLQSSSWFSPSRYSVSPFIHLWWPFCRSLTCNKRDSNRTNEMRTIGHSGRRRCREIIEKNMKWIKIRCIERTVKSKCYRLSKGLMGFRISNCQRGVHTSNGVWKPFSKPSLSMYKKKQIDEYVKTFTIVSVIHWYIITTIYNYIICT